MELVIITLLVFGLYLALSMLFKVGSLQGLKKIRSSK
jgi:putative peptidoglycan lipid II flippase